MKIQVSIRFNYGGGMKLDIELTALPRIGDEILMGGLIKTVTKLTHDIENDRVIVYTN